MTFFLVESTLGWLLTAGERWRNDGTKRDGKGCCGSCGSGAVRNCRTYDEHANWACFLSSSVASLPEPGTYNIDPVHSFAYFGAWHHIVGLVRGRFNKVTGTISATKDPADCAVDISIDTAGIDTQFARRDRTYVARISLM